MARTAVSVQQAVVAGAALTMNAAHTDGNSFENDGKTAIYVTNGGGSSLTVTIQAPDSGKDGLVVTDRTVTVPASASRLIGPFRKDVYDQSSGSIYVDWSVTTSITFAVIRIG